jgi:hypothetical protein
MLPLLLLLLLLPKPSRLLTSIHIQINKWPSAMQRLIN